MDFNFEAMAMQCAPAVHHKTLAYLTTVESSFNPYAIGVVGGHLVRQPRNLQEAIATAESLASRGINYSVGITQVNQSNFRSYGLTLETAFDTCKNMKAGAEILSDCYNRAEKVMKGTVQQNIQYALSCYYSGNFVTGFKHGYVQKILKVALNAK